MWILLALLSAVFAAARRTTEKKLAAKYHHFTLGWIIQLSSLPVITVMMLLTSQTLNPLELGLNFWLTLAAVCLCFYPLNTFLIFQALRHDELSNVLPIMSLCSVFSIFPAWIFLNEVPNPIAVIGIISIVAGVYALGLKGRALHRPWQPFLDNNSSRYTFLSVLLLSAVGVLDKIAVEASNALFFSFISTAGAVIVLLGLAFVSGTFRQFEKLPKPGLLMILGSLQGSSYTTYLAALSMGPIAYVSAIRSSSNLLGSLLGIIVLKEKFTANKKLSFLLIAIGSIVLALGS